ncbi:transposase tnpA, partial [mine drainage metagenome]
YATIRRATMAVDADELDRIVNTWAVQQADRRGRTRSRGEEPTTGAAGIEDDTTDPDPTGPDRKDHGNTLGADLVGVAVDGKAVRGARRDDGTQVQLLAALRHDTGMVIGQANVENDKTNEIVTFPALIGQLDLTDRVVTADAMHTQKNAATLVAGKDGHYIFG